MIGTSLNQHSIRRRIVAMEPQFEFNLRAGVWNSSV